VRRLAEDDVELANASENEAKLANERGDAAAARTRLGIAGRARRAAIEKYRSLVEPGASAYPQADEVEWFLALECTRVGDLGGARSAAMRLASDHPSSRYAARSYFLLGSFYEAEAKDDASKHAVAMQAFARVTRSPYPELARVALVHLEREARAAGDTLIADEAARRLASPAALVTVASETPRVTMASAGCSTDMQCKGSRICQAGACVDR
jgi:hypothetical protein